MMLHQLRNVTLSGTQDPHLGGERLDLVRFSRGKLFPRNLDLPPRQRLDEVQFGAAETCSAIAAAIYSCTRTFLRAIRIRSSMSPTVR